MKVKVNQCVESTQEVEVELPYYYKHDLMLDESDSVIYGRIGENDHFSVQLSYRGRHETVEFEKRPTNWNSCSCYLKDEYRSNQAEYEGAKVKALEFAKSA